MPLNEKEWEKSWASAKKEEKNHLNESERRESKILHIERSATGWDKSTTRNVATHVRKRDREKSNNRAPAISPEPQQLKNHSHGTRGAREKKEKNGRVQWIPRYCHGFLGSISTGRNVKWIILCLYLDKNEIERRREKRETKDSIWKTEGKEGKEKLRRKQRQQMQRGVNVSVQRGASLFSQVVRCHRRRILSSRAELLLTKKNLCIHRS